MQVLDKRIDATDVRLSRAEMGMLNNALNEICNIEHIKDWEFQTRLGVDRDTLRGLLRQINDCLKNSN